MGAMMGLHGLKTKWETVVHGSVEKRTLSVDCCCGSWQIGHRIPDARSRRESFSRMPTYAYAVTQESLGYRINSPFFLPFYAPFLRNTSFGGRSAGHMHVPQWSLLPIHVRILICPSDEDVLPARPVESVYPKAKFERGMRQGQGRENLGQGIRQNGEGCVGGSQGLVMGC